MLIKELIKDAHENATKHGFWDDWKSIITHLEFLEVNQMPNLSVPVQNKQNAICARLMLIVGEVAEAMEGLRKGDTDNFKEELADVAIRLADLCGGLDIDLELEIKKKMDKNKNRPYKHGKAF